MVTWPLCPWLFQTRKFRRFGFLLCCGWMIQPYSLLQKCLKKWIGSAHLGTRRISTPTLPIVPHPHSVDRQTDRQTTVWCTWQYDRLKSNWPWDRRCKWCVRRREICVRTTATPAEECPYHWARRSRCSGCVETSSVTRDCSECPLHSYAQNPLHTFPRHFPVDVEAANLLRTCCGLRNQQVRNKSF